MTRYFIFGQNYKAGDDYVRCERGHCMVVVPGVGETDANAELSLGRCLGFVRRNVMSEISTVGQRQPLRDWLNAMSNRWNAFTKRFKYAWITLQRRLNHE